MIEHILLPIVNLESCVTVPMHREWLAAWLEDAQRAIDSEDIAASTCLQGCLAEVALNGVPEHNWVDIFDTLLVRDGLPIAYSPAYVKRLYNFDTQGFQSPVHAIHARWWIARTIGDVERGRFADMVGPMIQSDGWIYNPLVSETLDRNRIRSERFMNLALGIEILKECGGMGAHSDSFAATIAQSPITPFVGAEYFRARSLDMLEKPYLEPAELGTIFEKCRAGEGFCDFSVADKRDEYMGTRTRVGRDIALHSPMSSLHIGYLARLGDDAQQRTITEVLRSFGRHLAAAPLDIPAFTIRDLKDIPFGTDVSVLEIISAADLIARAGAGI